MIKLWKLKIKPYNSGKLAEFICRLYMRLSGYRIIAKNYRCGELCGWYCSNFTRFRCYIVANIRFDAL